MQTDNHCSWVLVERDWSLLCSWLHWRSDVLLFTTVERRLLLLLTERFVTALEAEPQVYRRILNIMCSLGTALLPSGTLIPKLVKPRQSANALRHAHIQTNKYCNVRALSHKVKRGCSVQRIRKNINNLTASKQAPITLLDLLRLSRNKCICFLNTASNVEMLHWTWWVMTTNTRSPGKVV